MKYIISENYYSDKTLINNIDHFFKKYKVASLLKQSNFNKNKGVSSLKVIKYLFIMVFSGKNLYRILESKNNFLPFSKDVIYRFLKNLSFNWEKFLILLSSNIIKKTIYPLTSSDRSNVLIVDDTYYNRNRSKKVELLSKVRDHTDGKYKKGFRLLSLGWSDGNTFIPIAFNLLSSQNQKTRYNEINPSIDKRTNGYKRRNSSMQNTNDAMLELLERAKAYSIPAKYLLFDSWFSYPKVISKVRELEYHVISMARPMEKIYYKYKGKNMNLKSLYSNLNKSKTSKKEEVIASVKTSMVHKTLGEIPVKLVFLHAENCNHEWVTLISTDLDLADEEIIRIYGKRWDIEVFFKMNKSYLNLAKEFQCRSYDSMVAHTTIVFLRYIYLALELRKEKDPKTIGELFYLVCDDLNDISFITALRLIIDSLKVLLKDVYYLAEENIDELMSQFISSLPLFIRDRKIFFSCES